jgi:hypothetical protein
MGGGVAAMKIIENWPPRNILQIIALVASILGRVALFGLTVWLVWIVWRGGWIGFQEARIDWLGYALMAVIIGSLLRDIADGAILTPRKATVSKDGATVESGLDE